MNDLVVRARDGWGHLYLYGKMYDVKRIELLRHSMWPFSRAGMTKTEIFFVANGREKKAKIPYYEHLYRCEF